ncbi:T9SS type A sorting domain-containing protein [Hymenobacter cellulosivorans]|uniref:T9SS type A sorting domain-containing protein n=1 Tax=Hymenobacter cellulosivorans TaxID=2932249 RepID=A0ABY4FFS8_9BACT|nr:T9SS type A sorting domain-containing protein [Hymenobacter cellulosivorans]UOQ55363.1 T9SS type A sorting domain-containing protein [Hymenobacter cellulosivorans]
MQKQLLILALGLLSYHPTLAQTAPPVRQPRLFPSELQRQPVTTPAAGPSATARKPGKVTTYQWHYPSSTWSTTGTVERNTYDNQARRTQLVESDSATQRPTERISFTYNAAGLQTSGLQEVWDGLGWQNNSRTLETFNSANLLTELLDQGWRNGAWQNRNRTTIGYDSHNHETSYTSQEWRNNAWATTHAHRNTITYTAAGAVLEETQEYLDPWTNTYEHGPRRQYTYPSPTALAYSARIDQQWVNGAYENQRRVSGLVYDSQGNETSSVTEQWENGVWQLRSRKTTVYEPNGSSRGQSEERINNAWVLLGRYSHLYDDFGTELLYESEMRSNGAWSITEGYRYLVRYNANNDLIARVRQNYNTTTKAYDNGLKRIYGDYQSITLGAKPNAALAAQTQLYPNPTTGSVTLELAGLGESQVGAEVVNSLGQVVQRLTLPVRQGQSRLELGSLQAGVYTVQLHTSAGLVVKKVVRQ